MLGGVIANITSGLSSMTMLLDSQVLPQYPSYSISKIALNILIVHQEAELKGKGVVVCIDPGWVKP